MSYKRLTPCMFIDGGNAVAWFQDHTVISDDPISLANSYSDHGADELIIIDVSNTEEHREESIDTIRRINRSLHIPMIVGGNVTRLDDVKILLYAGAKRAIINLSKEGRDSLLEEAAGRFGKEKLAVSLDDFDALYKKQHLISDFSTEIVFRHRLDLNSVMSVTDLPFIVLTDAMEKEEIIKILSCSGVRGVSGKYISQIGLDLYAVKERCEEVGIKMTSFESIMEFSEFKLNPQGLIPVIVQHYKTNEVLMLAYMNEEAFQHTVRTGRMTYFSRSRNQLWVKGETSGHYQFEKSLTIDCDNDTLLAKVDQIGAACHTGNPTCFFQPLVGVDFTEHKSHLAFADIMENMRRIKDKPEDGSYCSEMLGKGTDKILKKMGEEFTKLLVDAKNDDEDTIKDEFTEFVYHSMLLMIEKNISWEEIVNALSRR